MEKYLKEGFEFEIKNFDELLLPQWEYAELLSKQDNSILETKTKKEFDSILELYNIDQKEIIYGRHVFPVYVSDDIDLVKQKHNSDCLYIRYFYRNQK